MVDCSTILFGTLSDGSLEIRFENRPVQGSDKCTIPLGSGADISLDRFRSTVRHDEYLISIDRCSESGSPLFRERGLGCYGLRNQQGSKCYSKAICQRISQQQFPSKERAIKRQPSSGNHGVE